MAFTVEQKQALVTWLEANLHKAVHTHTYREGIKDEDGKAVYATGYRDVPVYSDPVFDGDEQVGGGEQIGTEQVEYQYRTFNEVSKDYLFIDEVMLRVKAKAEKHGFAPTEDAVRALLTKHKDTIKSWLPVGVTIRGGRSHLRHVEVSAEDPDS